MTNLRARLFSKILNSRCLFNNVRYLGAPRLSAYAKFPKNLTCGYQGVRNISFSENFEYINGWTLENTRLDKNTGKFARSKYSFFGAVSYFKHSHKAKVFWKGKKASLFSISWFGSTGFKIFNIFGILYLRIFIIWRDLFPFSFSIKCLVWVLTYLSWFYQFLSVITIQNRKGYGKKLLLFFANFHSDLCCYFRSDFLFFKFPAAEDVVTYYEVRLFLNFS